MFSRKKEDVLQVNAVPVYTVHSLPRQYEPLQSICVQISNLWAKDLRASHREVMNALGVEGATLGADAVIGFMLHSQGVSPVLHAYGTAIKYKD